MSNPILVNKDRSITRLYRVDFRSSKYKEEFLQQLIDESPYILPMEDIEPAFSPLYSIGREISTAVGSIDNILITPQGYLVLVETKLWRNPESRREVIGQIIDYTKELVKWSYEELDTKCQQYLKKAKNFTGTVTDYIKSLSEPDEFDEISFIDRVNINLKQGKILLLIVGDGIQEGTEKMVSFLQNTPNLQFTLALVELTMYETENDELFIYPRTIFRTREVTRAIIRFEGDVDSTKFKVELEEQIKAKKGTSYTRISLSEEAFESEIKKAGDEVYQLFRRIYSHCEKLSMIFDYKTASVSIKFPDPAGSGTKFTILQINKDASVAIGGLDSLNWLKSQLEREGYPKSLAVDYYSKLQQLLENIPENKGKYFQKGQPLQYLLKLEKEFYDILDKLISEIEEIAKLKQTMNI